MENDPDVGGSNAGGTNETTDASNNAVEPPKKRVRRLVFGSLVANSALGLAAFAGISAEAHGNASSHKGAQINWNFDTFVVSRESMLSPDAAATGLLKDIQKDTLATKVNLIKHQNFMMAQPGPDTFQRMQHTNTARALNQEALRLELQLRQSLDRLQLSPLSSLVLDQLTAGKPDEAIKIIESSGTVDKVLSNYSLVQLDLYNYGAIAEFSSPQYLAEIKAVTNAALAYQQSAAPAALDVRAGFLHNLASAAAPDTGTVSAADAAAGMAAAQEALKLRKQLGEPRAIGVAEYMVGIYHYRAGKNAAAQQAFTNSLAQLQAPEYVEDRAWSRLYLGLAKKAAGDKGGEALVNQAREAFKQANNKTALALIARQSTS